MKVFVIHKDGYPLMPTHPAKARILLKKKEAKIVRMIPFTIQLLRDSGSITQEVSLGIDPGETVGFSVTTEKEVLFEAQMKHRDEEVKENLSTRREARSRRRNKKTHYRKARFMNRKKGKGWIAPSLRMMLLTYQSMFSMLKKILPISKVYIEYNQFDIQKLKNPDIQGEEYQNGEQKGSYDVREYVLHRDKHTCQNCGKHTDFNRLHKTMGDFHCFSDNGNKSNNDNKKVINEKVILETHHIISRKIGGDRPDNLVTLCKECHDGYHDNTVKLKAFKLSPNFKFPAKMNILKDRLMDLAYKMFGINNVHKTFGSITKSRRIEQKLKKDHHIDARMISGNVSAKSSDIVYYFKKVRRHNRKIYKDKILSGGKRKINQCPYTVNNFHRYDLVKFEGKLLYINGLRKMGSFQCKDLLDKTFATSRTYKKLRLIQHRKGFVVSAD